MKYKSLWLFVIFAIAIAIFLFGIYLFFRPLRISKEIFENDVNTSLEDIYSFFEGDQIFKIKANLNLPLLANEGLVFPEFNEEIKEVISVDFEERTISDGINSNALEEVSLPILLINELELFKLVSDNSDYSFRDNSSSWIYSLSSEASEIYIKAEIERFLNERFEDNIQIEDIVYKFNGSRKLDLKISNETNHRVGVDFYTDNVEVSFNMSSPEIDLLLTNNPEFDSSGELIIEEFNYSYEITNSTLKESFQRPEFNSFL